MENKNASFCAFNGLLYLVLIYYSLQKRQCLKNWRVHCFVVRLTFSLILITGIVLILFFLPLKYLSWSLTCLSGFVDSWFQAAFVLTTGVNSAYVLGYPGTVMVPLGWIAGVIGLLAATGISLFANALVAKLHEYGGKRHIRYRDLAGFIYGVTTLF